jgi:hypothetical protein
MNMLRAFAGKALRRQMQKSNLARPAGDALFVTAQNEHALGFRRKSAAAPDAKIEPRPACWRRPVCDHV